MPKEEKPQFIYKELARTSSSDYSGGEVYMQTCIATGESKIIVKRTIGEVFSVQQYYEAMKTHERLQGDGVIITIDDLLKLRGYQI